MTAEYRGQGGAVGPPWSVDVLADLHAGVLDEHVAAELWPRVNADPEARAILDALESTTSDLSALADGPVEPMPADVAARIDAAVAEEQRARETTGGSNVVGLDAARKRRKRQARWGAGLVAAAAAVVAAVAIAVPGGGGDTTGGVAEPAPSQNQNQDENGSGDAPLAFTDATIGSAYGKIDGLRDYGPLGSQQRLDACLAANNIRASERPVGFTPVTLNGRDAVLVLYTTGEIAQFRAVALAPDCGPDNPGTLMDKTIGKGS